MVKYIVDKQQIEINGVRYKDNVHNFRLLHAKGLMDEGPITRHYDFKSRHSAPMPHQVETCEFMCLHTRGHIHNAIGTGKTLIAYWYFDYLKKEGLANRALTIAPLSTIYSVHADTLRWSFPHLSFSVLHGSKEKRIEKLMENKDVYIINFNGFLARWSYDRRKGAWVVTNGDVLRAFIARNDIDCVFIDEVAELRNAKTNTARNIKYLYGVQADKPSLKVWGFSGSPLPKAPTDVYGQALLINPDALPQKLNFKKKCNIPISFTQFKERTMIKDQYSEFVWHKKQGWEEKCQAALQPSIRFTRKMVEPDLPPTTLETREIKMSPEQSKAYKEMMATCRMELRSGEKIDAVSAGVKLLKLLQISAGVVYGANKEAHQLSCRAKLDELIKIKYQIGNHLLVAVPFVSIADYLMRELRKLYTVGCIVGQKTGVGQRTKLISQFTNADLDILIATPGSIPHGINLQNQCNTTLWWGPIPRYDHYEQFNGRNDRKGQTKPVLIIHFQSSPADKAVYAKLKTKQSAQTVLLELLKGTK